MATPAYDGGIGGKIRKRLLRRPTVTPYDRPSVTPHDRPSAAARTAAVPPSSGSWLRSLIVDPASRLISSSAFGLFSSFKRIAAPPAAPPPEENHQSREAIHEVACINPSHELHDRGFDGGQQTKSSNFSSDTDGISELEKLLKQKTFTRVEFDHVTELLRSRTVEPSTSEPAIDIEKKENEDNSALENGVQALILHEDPSITAASVTVTRRDEVASPAELAKAYMGSRPSKVSPSSLSLRSQVFHEDTTITSIVSSVSKPLSRSVVPRSVIRFSGIPELPENGYQTPKPQDGSTFYPTYCSPYLKVHPTTDVKGKEPTVDDYAGPSLSRLTPSNSAYSGGRQVLKRRSSVLDGDFDSFGPVRRIRQKSYLSFPREGYSILSNKEVNRGSSLQKPSRKGFKHRNTILLEAENKEKKFVPTSVTPVPPKSSQTAMKIFEKLDIIVSSPKEKSPQLKAIARDKSPSDLTPNVSGGRASRKLGDIDPSKFCSVQDKGSLDNGDSQLFSFRNSLSEKQYKVEEIGPSQSAFSRGSASLPPPRETSPFRRRAFEDPFVCDDDKPNLGDPSGSLSSKSDELDAKPLKHSEKSLMSSSNIPDSPSSLKDAGMKGSGSLVLSGKDSGFSFSVASGPSTQSQPPPVPTMHVPSLDVSTPGKEHTVAPTFSFGSKADRRATISTTMTSIADTTCQNIGARDATLGTVIEGSGSCRSGEMPKDEKLSEPFGTDACSGISVTNSSSVFGYGADTTTSQSNGSQYSSSLISRLSAAPTVTYCDSRVASTFFTSTATTANTSPVISVSGPSFSSSVPTFSKATSFKFGSSTSMAASVSNANSSNDLKNLEAEKVGTDSSTVPFSSLFSSPSSTGFFTKSAFSSSNSSSSTQATLATSPSTGSNSASLAASSAVTSTGDIFSFSVPAASSAVTSTGSIFSFSVPAQLSTSANMSQNSIASGATAGYALGSQATQSGSESLSSRNQFGSFSSSPAFGVSKPFSSGFGSSPSGLATSGTKTSTTSGFLISGGFASSGPGTSTLMPSAATSLFSPSSHPFTPSAFGSSFSSSASSPSPGSLFGQLSSASSSSMLTLDSSKPVFSLTSAVSAPSSATSLACPVFGNPAFGFSSGSPGNSQMNVENSMADVTNPVTAPSTPTFGQPVNSPTTPNFVFGSGTTPSSGIVSSQFVSNQNPFTPQSPPFQAGNLGFTPGGVFSVGTGVGDKSGRKIIKIKRDKKHKR